MAVYAAYSSLLPTSVPRSFPYGQSWLIGVENRERLARLKISFYGIYSKSHNIVGLSMEGDGYG